MKWLYLGVAIIAEIFATSALKGSEGFTRLVPSLIIVVNGPSNPAQHMMPEERRQALCASIFKQSDLCSHA